MTDVWHNTVQRGRSVIGIITICAIGLAPTVFQAQQQAGAAPPDPTLREMSDDSTAVVLPEQKALDAALRISRPTDRLAALDKILASYPASPVLNNVDAQVLSLVLQMPDAEDSAAEVFTRMLARIPASATADVRFQETVAPAARLIGRKVLLDQTEKALTAALAPRELSSHLRAAGHYQLGRLAAARGDMVKAEAEYRAGASESPAAVSALVGLFLDRGQQDKAEQFLLEVVKSTPVNVAALTSLTNLYRADPVRSEAILRDAVGRDPMLPAALISLAKLEHARGDEASALDRYLTAAAMQFMRGPDAEALTALYTKRHGSLDTMEAEINKRYLTLPKALKATPYSPTPARTNRVVLVEMFTGSACPPCVAADLAFDAVMDRYDRATVIPISYHQHIPGPDPMVTPETAARRDYYSINGVPTMHIGGALAANEAGTNLGGGGRSRAPAVYDEYVKLIDRALETPSDAALSVTGAIAGDAVTVTTNVTALPANASGLTLHVILAEKTLLFGGENGIRGHHMVVRGMAGANGQGQPLSATGNTTHTFNLATIRQSITRSLAQDIARRRAGGGSQTFAAEDRAMTTIDPSQLVAIAFVQAGNKRVIQSTIAPVTGGTK